MGEFMRSLKARKFVADSRFRELVREAAKLGLGVYVPHLHTAQGETALLPTGWVALEQDGVVSFVSADSPHLVDATPVAWRWEPSCARSEDSDERATPMTNGRVVVTALCCTKRRPPSPGKVPPRPPVPKEPR